MDGISQFNDDGINLEPKTKNKKPLSDASSNTSSRYDSSYWDQKNLQQTFAASPSSILPKSDNQHRSKTLTQSAEYESSPSSNLPKSNEVFKTVIRTQKFEIPILDITNPASRRQLRDFHVSLAQSFSEEKETVEVIRRTILEEFICRVCDQYFHSSDELKLHFRSSHDIPPTRSPLPSPTRCSSLVHWQCENLKQFSVVT